MLSGQERKRERKKFFSYFISSRGAARDGRKSGSNANGELVFIEKIKTRVIRPPTIRSKLSLMNKDGVTNICG